MILVYFFPNQTSPSKIKVIVLQSFVNASSDLLIMKLFFILACFGIIQALRFRDVFEVEYLLNIGKKTVIQHHCGSQKLDPMGTFFNDGESISNNFCKLSTEQKNQIRQRLSQIEKKWTIAKTTVCYGVTVEYPKFQISTLFDSMIQTGNGAAINGLTVSNDSNFWEYVQKGTVY